MLLFLSLLDTEEEKTKFEKIYNCYRSKMMFTAYGILHNRQDAENIVQDSFIALIENLEKIQEVSCHKTWNYIVTIVKNKSFNLLKQKKKVLPSDMDEELEKADGDQKNLGEMAEEQEMAEVLAELIKELPFPYKEVLYLQYVNGMDQQSIAEVLDKSHDNIRQISLRARSKLKKRLEARGYQGV